MTGGGASSGPGRAPKKGKGVDAVWEAMRMTDEDPALPGEKSCRELSVLWGRPYISVDCYLRRLERDGKVTSRIAKIRIGHCLRDVRVYRPVAGVKGLGSGPGSAAERGCRPKGAAKRKGTAR